MQPNSFIYLKRVSKDDAYDFCIVPQEYGVDVGGGDDVEPVYTLSAEGLTTQLDMDEVEFVPLDDFEREYQIYNQIVSLPFFSQYHKWKGFTQWKNEVTSKRISKAKKILSDELFILHEDLCPSLLKLRRLCYELSLLRLHQVDSSSTLTMEAFVSQQARQKEKVRRSKPRRTGQ